MAEISNFNVPIPMPVKKAAGGQNKEFGVNHQPDKTEDSFGKVMKDTADTTTGKDDQIKDSSKVDGCVRPVTKEETKEGESAELKPGEIILLADMVQVAGEITAPAQILLSNEAAAVKPELQPLIPEGVAAAQAESTLQAGNTPQAGSPAGTSMAETQLTAEAQAALKTKTHSDEKQEGQPALQTEVLTKEPAKTAAPVTPKGETGQSGQSAQLQNTEIKPEVTVESSGREAEKTIQTTETDQTDKTSQMKQPEKEADKLDISVLQQMMKGTEGARLQTEPVRIKVAEPFNNVDENLMKQLGEKVTQNLSEGKQELNIQLTPEHLGKITIKITVLNESVKVLLTCDNQKTLGLLAERSDGLGHIIENNMKSPVVVEVKEDGYWNQQKNATDQHENQNGNQQEQQGRKNQKDEADGFLQQMRLGLFEERLVI